MGGWGEEWEGVNKLNTAARASSSRLQTSRRGSAANFSPRCFRLAAMSLNLEWGAVAGAAPTRTVAIGFKHGTAGFDMQQKNNQAREQTEASRRFCRRLANGEIIGAANLP